MLSNLSRDFYFDSLRGKDLSFREMTAAVKRWSITAEHEQNLLCEWDNLTLNSVMAANAEKSPTFRLEELVTCMHALKSGLPGAYLNDKIFKNKLLNAAHDVYASTLAYFKPADTVEGFISDLHCSLAIETVTRLSLALNAHFVDRKFRGGHGRHQNPSPNRNDLRWIVCINNGFWATNHCKYKRLAALRNNKRVRQFVSSIDERPIMRTPQTVSMTTAPTNNFLKT